jgi:membrane-associated HD superfamily phosphohydrolase
MWVDPSSGAVVDHKSADHQKADIGDFIKAQKNRGSELEDKFRKAKEEQEKRKSELEQRFKSAREIADQEDDAPQSPFDWD